MAYIQRVTPPPNKILNFSLKNFVGALNNRSEQLLVNEASNLINLKFADDTVMETRNGTMAFDTLTLTKPIVYIDEYKPYTEANKMIRATEDEVYVDSVKLCDVAGRINGINHMGMYFFVDGVKIRVYGKFAQTSTTYEVVVGTAVNDYVLMEVVSPPAGYVELDDSHEQGVFKIDYTNSKVWYEPCHKEFVDTNKGANVVPSDINFIVGHNGRLFLTGSAKDNDKVFISQITKGKGCYFPAVLPLQIPPDSDAIRGMIVYDSSVILGRKYDMYIITGNTNVPNIGFEVFKLRKLNTHTGIANNDAMMVAHNYLFYLGSDGNAYSLGTTKSDDRTLITTVISKSIELNKEPINIAKTDYDKATSIFFEDEWYLSIMDKVLVYSYRHKAWTMYNHFDARSFYNKDGVLIWGNVDGVTAKFSDDYFDFGKPFKSFWTSKDFDMDDANSFKQFKEFFLVAHTYETVKSDIYVIFDVDYNEIRDRAVIKNQISVFGLAKWGDRFTKRNVTRSLPFVIGRRGITIRFTFMNGYENDGAVDTFADLDTYLGKKQSVIVVTEDTGKYYIFDNQVWVELTALDLNQCMKIYQVNGDYEIRGKR